MDEKGKVTIYDLAQKLNTTASTVSRALQNNLRISVKMRKAVQALANELHYIPDPVAHHLRTGKGNVLGIIVPCIDRHYFASIISSFQKTAQKQNYNIIIAASNENQEEEAAAVMALLSKKVDGIAMSLSAVTVNPNYEDFCKAHNTPLLFFDRTPNEYQADSVTNDNYQLGYDAVVQLNKTGKKKIGHFAGPLTQKVYADRFAGYKKAIEDLGLEFNQNLVYERCITFETGEETAKNILSSDEKPDAIFSAGDFSAITAMDTLKREGINIPQDISFIGVANEPFDNYLCTPLTSFDLHEQRIGELAATLLLERIADKDKTKEPQRIIVQHDLILRNSAQ